MPLLTKSNYMAGLSCPGSLWMMFHDLDRIPDFDLATEHIIQQGKIIGQLAKKLFDGGVDLPAGPEAFTTNIRQTEESLKKREIIFEAGIVAAELYSRADILIPVGKDEWNIIEVKSSTKVKEEHIHDLSFQKHVYHLAGLKIKKCFLLRINNGYVKKGEINLKELLTQEEVTADVEEVILGIQERVAAMIEIVNGKEPPKVRIGNGCMNGVGCVSEDCWNFLPEDHVFELHRGGKRSLVLLEAGILSIKDIPHSFKLNNKQEIQRKCAISGTIYINNQNIKKFLNAFEYPIYFLDFETFQTAVPLYDGTNPYQQIPFQFSLHVDDGREVKHFEFLHDSKSDPREKFLEEMKKVLGTEGSIIVFYQSFEIGRLKELAEAFPEYKEWVGSAIERIVDLIVPFKNFDYYNPSQKGSYSIKAVLPAITGKSYEELNIDNGMLASASYFENVFNGVGTKEQIRKDLLEYCGLDTEGMVWIVDGLRKRVRQIGH